ncbi:hypothetical protein NX794_01430 [Streptomyces sp. LP11]|uniref:Uncharacterized protein n=1 Tax=Streptomyces pyxinicus TaxID=2970331 RepID=A0ABT2AUH1_9ACTN|nr:hypothetical protein [Streptomyces sp. LP11]MCS0599908.1 hypothetical protein [Streptomyces sp. LP11]
MSEGRAAGVADAGTWERGDPRPRVAGPFPAGFRYGPAPVGIRRHRHEGIVVTNLQRRRGLTWLAASWELGPAGGRTLTAPAELPDLRPGRDRAPAPAIAFSRRRLVGDLAGGDGLPAAVGVGRNAGVRAKGPAADGPGRRQRPGSGRPGR